MCRSRGMGSARDQTLRTARPLSYQRRETAGTPPSLYTAPEMSLTDQVLMMARMRSQSFLACSLLLDAVPRHVKSFPIPAPILSRSDRALAPCRNLLGADLPCYNRPETVRIQPSKLQTATRSVGRKIDCRHYRYPVSLSLYLAR